MGRRLIQPRSGDKKEHGLGKGVEGNFKAGETVGLIDDLITNGGAKMEAIQQIEEAGLVFGGIAMLVDREQGGFRDLAARGMPLMAATTSRSLLSALYRADLVPEQYKDQMLNVIMA
jgi:orotate phosphoribosyltransferase